MMERPRSLKTWVEPAGRRGFTLRAAVGLVTALCLLFATVQGWLVFSAAPGIQAGPRVVEIPAHRGLFEVAQLLDGAGVIRSPLGFTLLSVSRGSARSLKAGEYQIPQGANTLRILSLLEGGQVLQHNIVFREGSTVAELAQQLTAEGLAPGEDVRRVAKDGFFLRTLDIPAASVEGYLFPDTYQFVKGMTPEEMLARMVARMREQLSPELLGQARARNLSLHQLLTLASIIEKEAVDPGEMRLISAVFWNRMKRDMPLQADPTVQYAVGKERQRLSRENLQVDSPFNTYRRLGLPPGPIASPGRAALEAAVRPANVNYLYFVAMDERRHQFSSTLAEHHAAVAKYRLARTR